MVKGKSQVVVQVDSHEGNIASYCACKIAQCASSLAICASSLAPLYKLPFVRGPSPSPTRLPAYNLNFLPFVHSKRTNERYKATIVNIVKAMFYNLPTVNATTFKLLLTPLNNSFLKSISNF